MDETHPGFVPDHPYQGVIKAYYQYVDQWIGRLLSHVDHNTLVMVMSDHGAKKMDGGFALNQWLMEEGYLVLKEAPTLVKPIQPVEVDWAKTRVWSAGGYYGRVFFNVANREPEGIIPPAEYESFRTEVMEKIKAIPREDGKPMQTKVFRPEEVYTECRNIPPDLIVYLDDLNFRVIANVGYDSLYITENDTGPDDANHAEEGILIMQGHGEQGERVGLNLVDIAPTILHHLQVEIPKDWEGKIIT
jgi:predicted AlkP superfamily phosphohydrolase/phosphomutase